MRTGASARYVQMLTGNNARCTAQVFTVVKAMQQTTVSADSPVMTVKGSTTPVQVANSEFYVDPATGLFRTRTPPGPTSGSSRHLLQDVDPTARISSADFNLVSDGLVLTNVFSQPSIFASLSSMDAEDDLGSNTSSSSAGGLRRLLAEAGKDKAPMTVLPPVCDWGSDDLFDLSSCDQTTATGDVSLSNHADTKKPFYHKCDSPKGACKNFRFGTQVSLPMWVQSYGDGTFSMGGRMCVVLSCAASYY